MTRFVMLLPWILGALVFLGLIFLAVRAGMRSARRGEARDPDAGRPRQ